MLSPERNIPTPPNRFRGIALTTTLAVASLSSAGDVVKPSSFNPGLKSAESAELARNPNQIFGAFAYGTGKAKDIERTGDIATGAQPINGEHYGEADIAQAFQRLREWEYTHLDFIAFSWHSKNEVRDRFLDFFMNVVMKHPDNPYKELKISLILEADSNKDTLGDRRIGKDLEHLNPYLKDPHFLKDKDGHAIFFVFAQENEPFNGNFGYLERWNREAEKVGAVPINEDFVGSVFFDPEGKYKKFNYGNNIWDILPSGLDITDDVARVTFGYHKPGKPPENGKPGQAEDFKRIPRDPERIKHNIVEAINSKRKIIVFISINEGAEHSGAGWKIYKVLHKTIPTLPSGTVSISGDQYVDMIQRRADRLLATDSTNQTSGKSQENIVIVNKAIREKPKKKKTK